MYFDLPTLSNLDLVSYVIFVLTISKFGNVNLLLLAYAFIPVIPSLSHCNFAFHIMSSQFMYNYIQLGV